MRFFLGLALILISLLTAWMGFTQADAFYLANAIPFEEGLEDGTYVWIEGETKVEAAPLCPGSEEVYCLKTYLKVEEYLTENQIVCGELTDNVRVIEQEEDRCDAEGNCEPCYEAEVSNWELTQNQTEWAELRVEGVYVDIEGAVFLDELKSQTETENRIENASWFAAQDELLVAGPVQDNAIMSHSENPFIVVSNYDYETSFDELVLRDKSIRQGLSFGAFLLWVSGFVLLSSQFIKPIAGLLRVVPVFGKWADDGVQAAAYMIIAVLAGIVWCFTSLVAHLLILI